MAKAAGNGDLDVGPAENIEMMEGEPRIRPQVCVCYLLNITFSRGSKREY